MLRQNYCANLHNVFPEQEHEAANLASNTDSVPGSCFNFQLTKNNKQKGRQVEQGTKKISDMALVFLSSSVTPGVTISQLITSGCK
jgi:hypothetical protein